MGHWRHHLIHAEAELVSILCNCCSESLPGIRNTKHAKPRYERVAGKVDDLGTPVMRGQEVEDGDSPPCVTDRRGTRSDSHSKMSESVCVRSSHGTARDVSSSRSFLERW